MMDCYAVLGVRQDATQDEIKEAFRERALECHPDRVADEKEGTAKEEFMRVRKAFDVLSDPQKRAAYDAKQADDSDPSAESLDDLNVRKRSFKEEWRSFQNKREVYVSQVILDRVDGLSADYETVQSRRSLTVPLFSVLGTLFFLYEPGAIYATDVFLVDLILCTIVGGIYGFVIGSAWGYAELYFRGKGEGAKS